MFLSKVSKFDFCRYFEVTFQLLNYCSFRDLLTCIFAKEEVREAVKEAEV